MTRNLEEIARVYPEWPPEVDGRLVNARDIFGWTLVSNHDLWLDTFYRAIVKAEPQRLGLTDPRLLQAVCEKLSEEDRLTLFRSSRALVNGLVFSLLGGIDGVSGSMLTGEFRERLIILMNIFTIGDFGEGREDSPIESIRVNDPDDTQLHEMWYEWLDRFSEWTDSPELKPHAGSSPG